MVGLVRLPNRDRFARKILLESENYFINDEGLLFYLPITNNRTNKDNTHWLVIPHGLKHEILVHCHDSPLAGHLGFQKTYDKIRSRYFWKNMYRDCEVRVRSCIDCSMKLNPRTTPHAPVIPIPVDGAFDRVHMDILGPFNTTPRGNRYILC